MGEFFGGLRVGRRGFEALGAERDFDAFGADGRGLSAPFAFVSESEGGDDRDEEDERG